MDTAVINASVKGAGEYRKEIYGLMKQVIGRDLTSNEHAYMSNLLKDYVRSHAPDVRFVPQTIDSKPIEHHYICGACKNKKTGVGNDFNRKFKNKQKFATAEEAATAYHGSDHNPS